MSRTYALFVLICTAIAVISEVITLLFPRRLLAIFNEKPENLKIDRFYIALGILSVFYMIDIGLLIFSGDTFFRLYGIILITLSILLWLFKNIVKSMRYILPIESTICLILLLDISRTIVTAYLR